MSSPQAVKEFPAQKTISNSFSRKSFLIWINREECILMPMKIFIISQKIQAEEW